MIPKTMSMYDRKQHVLDLRKQAKELNESADAIQKAIDADEDYIWNLVQKHKEEVTRSGK